jgi:hypothetical protein
MRSTIFAACAGLAIAGLTLSAQTPTPRPSQPQTPAPAAASSDQKPMTVTGCLKRWSASTMGSGTPATPEAGAPTAAAGADAQYVLTDVDEVSRKPGSTETPSGTPHAMYLVKAKDASVNLTRHVNHKVQVTGTVSSDSSLKTASTANPTTPSPKPADPPPPSLDTSAAAGKPATLTVSSVTMVSATCSTTSH